MDLDPIALITSGAIVIFLTQQAKRWIPTDLLPLVALVLGIVVQLVNDLALASSPATSASIWTSIVLGAGVGMAAAGTYDLAGRAGASIPPATITVDQAFLEAEAPTMTGYAEGAPALPGDEPRRADNDQDDPEGGRGRGGANDIQH